jgi:predicted amidohydrolase YtcJ
MQKLIFIILFILCFSKIAVSQHADVIFTNANIVTAAKKGARANAMAIKGGKILFVGDIKNSLQYKNAKTNYCICV